MPNPNQSNLPVSKEERELLNIAKNKYEGEHGSGDWGKFLVGLAAGYLLSRGLAERAKVVKQGRGLQFHVHCPHCQNSTMLIVKGQPASADTIICPHCNQQFVVAIPPIGELRE